MLYKLFYLLQSDFSGLNVFRYITFRTILSALTALIICFVFGGWTIRKLRSMQIGQYIREDGPPNHKKKKGTPTMGGCLILPAIIISTLLWVDLNNIYVGIVMFVTFSFGGIGFADDYLKVSRKNSQGLSARSKFSLQIASALIVAFVLYFYSDFDSSLNLPFFKRVSPDLGWGYIPLIVFIIVGSSNAVNLTDGLDGLAISPIIVAFGSYLVFSYMAGHVTLAEYLQIPYVSGAGEISALCGAVAGAGLGFLWYNTYPAQIFFFSSGISNKGCSYVASHKNIVSSILYHTPEGRRDSCFTIGPGYRDYGSINQTAGKFQFADHLCALVPGSAKQGHVMGHSRTDNDHICVQKGPFTVAPCFYCNPQPSNFSAHVRIKICLRVHFTDGYIRSCSCQRACCPEPGNSQAHNYNFFPREFHLSFSVLKEHRARIIEMIQNLTITLGSGQPFSSK